MKKTKEAKVKYLMCMLFMGFSGISFMYFLYKGDALGIVFFLGLTALCYRAAQICENEKVSDE